MVVFHGAQTGRHAGEYFNEISIYVPYAGCMRHNSLLPVTRVILHSTKAQNCCSGHMLPVAYSISSHDWCFFQFPSLTKK